MAPASGALPSIRKIAGEARHLFQLGEFVGAELRLAARHLVALARAADGSVEQHMQRQTR